VPGAPASDAPSARDRDQAGRARNARPRDGLDRPFHAHEVLEAAWKAAPPAERELWRGLAQLAVGLTHARRGNGTGAVTLLRRGADRITSTDWSRPHGLDTIALAGAATALADRIARDGTATLPPGRLLPPLACPD
jgi:hypothetical protein